MMRLIPIFALCLTTAATAQDKPAGMDFETFSQAAMARLMKADVNGDGKLSKDEYTSIAKARGATRDGSRMFDRMDTDHDGVLDAAEIRVMLAHRFARLDANHDGILTAEERQAGRGAAADPGQ
jgi:Ca2+-binding EF-hand superfamily protein